METQTSELEMTGLEICQSLGPAALSSLQPLKLEPHSGQARDLPPSPVTLFW